MDREGGGQKRKAAGITLVTLAIVLLLLGAALAAGTYFMRASLAVDATGDQREALQWADKAILSYAAIHHHLPCPAATPDAAGDCALVKGYLPARDLNLDATLFRPGLLPMRYMVYAGTTAATNTYEPKTWNRGAKPDPADIADSDPHDGRVSLSAAFNQINGLDLCETLRGVRAGFGLNGQQNQSTGRAHYLSSGGAPLNVAYGVASAGQGIASAGGSRFEGLNAGGSPAMEAPDKAHGADYNDHVFARDIPSLMTALGCQPVAYTAAANYQAQGSRGTYTGKADDSLSPILPDGVTLGTSDRIPSSLNVRIDRTGIAAPMIASAQSVAFSMRLIDEVDRQFGLVKADAESAKLAGIVKSTVLGIKVAVGGTIKIVGNGIAIATSSGLLAACLGLCPNFYVAIALYSASIASAAAGMGAGIGAEVYLIESTMDATKIVGYMGGDNSNMASFCGDMQANRDALLLAYQGLIDDAAAKVGAAELEKNNACGAVVNNAATINQCVVDLGLDLLQTMSCGGNPPTEFAPNSDYRTGTYDEVCGFGAIHTQYNDFYTRRETLYDEFYTARAALANLDKQIADKQQEVNAFNHAAYKAELLSMFGDNPTAAQQAYAEAQATLRGQTLGDELQALQGQRAEKAAVRTEKWAALQTAVSSVNNASIGGTSAGSIPCIAVCQTKLDGMCGSAKNLIVQSNPSGSAGNTNEPTNDKYDWRGGAGVSSWDQCQIRTDAWKLAVANHAEIVAKQPPATVDCSGASGSGTVVVWPKTSATAVLRHADRRGSLQ